MGFFKKVGRALKRPLRKIGNVAKTAANLTVGTPFTAITGRNLISSRHIKGSPKLKRFNVRSLKARRTIGRVGAGAALAAVAGPALVGKIGVKKALGAGAKSKGLGRKILGVGKGLVSRRSPRTLLKGVKGLLPKPSNIIRRVAPNVLRSVASDHIASISRVAQNPTNEGVRQLAAEREQVETLMEQTGDRDLNKRVRDAIDGFVNGQQVYESQNAGSAGSKDSFDMGKWLKKYWGWVAGGFALLIGSIIAIKKL